MSDEFATKDNHFTGTINWVQLRAGLADHDHLIDPRQRLKIAMTNE